jgi:hypothetical protein
MCLKCDWYGTPDDEVEVGTLQVIADYCRIATSVHSSRLVVGTELVVPEGTEVVLIPSLGDLLNLLWSQLE